MFSPKLLDHFENPRYAGELAPPAIVAEAENPACGDVLRLFALVENGVAAEVRFQVRGCTASVAAGSAVAEALFGRSRDEAAAISATVVDDALGGLPTASRHAAQLGADAVKALLRVWH